MAKQNILLSIITPTLNNQKHIKNFLDSIKKQNFPKAKLEIIISDGGSTDKTIEIAKKMGARIVKNPYVYADPGVNLGIKAAKGEILMVLACDNIYEDKDALEKIVKVFDNKNITAVFPIHSSSDNDSVFTKYINTFTDPFNHFVYGYAANGRTFKKIYKTIESNEIYETYDYSSNSNKPLIAVAQGFTVRSGFTKSRKSEFDDILPVMELVNKKSKIAFAYSVKLYHHTVRDLKHFTNKQMWATINALQRKKYGIAHRKNYLSKSQQKRIKIWPLYCLSILPPFIYALYHIIKDRELMWIFHPFLCIISGYTSVFATLIFLLNKNAHYQRKS
jgi:glycosyltransferase involved in cell wall biosynthesis